MSWAFACMDPAQATAQALHEAVRQGEYAFFKTRVNELTGGDSLAANIALMLNNARLAAAIAQA